jgi:hypothetical protein
MKTQIKLNFNLVIPFIIVIICLYYIRNEKIEKFSNYEKSNSILIIGNAPIKKKNMGEKIDKFDYVVRFNNYKIEGYESDIGKKITDWIISDTYCLLYYDKFKKTIDRHLGLNINIIIPNVFKDNKQKLYQKISSDILEKCNILIQDKDLIVDKKYNFGRRWPSSGILAIYYYLKFFDKVTIFGFNNFDSKEGSIHYYEDRKQIGHNNSIEKQILDDLEKDGRLIRL